jgi:ElaB/YqjD/DUF883 family membrane-anchored ribosome-binding protein
MESTMNPSTNSDEDDGAISRGIKNAELGAHQKIDKAADFARPAVESVARGAHRAIDEVGDVASRASETLSANGEQIKAAEAHVLDYVRRHPLASFAVAIAAGFFVSRLLR